MSLRWFLSGAILAAWLIMLGGAVFPMAEPPTRTIPVSFKVVPGIPNPNDVFELVNKSRADKQLPLLVPDAFLTKIAQSRAADMATRKYYGHRDGSGNIFEDHIKSAGQSIAYGCENLDMQFIADSRLVVNDWLESHTGHRECLLNKRVAKAGYAVTPFETVDKDGHVSKSYIVVAIHASEPEETIVANR